MKNNPCFQKLLTGKKVEWLPGGYFFSKYYKQIKKAFDFDFKGFL
jgi:hypothetical protein